MYHGAGAERQLVEGAETLMHGEERSWTSVERGATGSGEK